MKSSGPSQFALAAPERGIGRPLVFYFDRVGIVMIHVGTIVAFCGRITPGLVGMAVAFYGIRMFAITGGYHRYFAHRAFKTSRWFQFALALLGTTASQKGPLWWASSHREHHRYSDTPRDLHSPRQRGFWHAHMGWWFGHEYDETDLDKIKDFAKFPELRFLDRWYHVGIVTFIAVTVAIGGWQGFLWGYVVSTCALMHGTFAINSLAHVVGSRRYETDDTSRNNGWLAAATLGEGWHNNHHHYMNSANQGFFWWEIDVTYYVLRLLSSVGIIWDVRTPPPHVLQTNLISSDTSG